MNYNKTAKNYIKKMCHFAEVDYNSINFNKDLWQNDYTWTKDQMEAFREWMREDLRSHKAKRNMVMNNPSKNNIAAFVNSFVAAYGFKCSPQ